MHNISTYIIEKLKLSKDIQEGKSLNPDHPQCIEDVMIATCLSALRKHSYRENSGFRKTLRSLSYTDIKKILEEYFNYYVDIKDIKRNGLLIKMIRTEWTKIECLVNGYKVIRPGYKANDDYSILNGRTLQKKYEDILNEKN